MEQSLGDIISGIVQKAEAVQMRKKDVTVGMKVTCLYEVEAYYSGMKTLQGVNPVVIFKPGDVGIVAVPRVPKVQRQGYFHAVDFERDGKTERVALDTDNIRRVES